MFKKFIFLSFILMITLQTAISRTEDTPSLNPSTMQTKIQELNNIMKEQQNYINRQEKILFSKISNFNQEELETLKGLIKFMIEMNKARREITTNQFKYEEELKKGTLAEKAQNGIAAFIVKCPKGRKIIKKFSCLWSYKHNQNAIEILKNGIESGKILTKKDQPTFEQMSCEIEKPTLKYVITLLEEMLREIEKLKAN